MSLNEAHPILMAVQTLYPGGQDGFVRDGGGMTMIRRPAERDQLWVYMERRDEEAQRFVEAFTGVVEGLKALHPIDLEWRYTPAFEQESDAELQRDLLKALIPHVEDTQIAVGMPSKTIVPLAMPEDDVESEAVERVAEAVRNVPGLRRTIISARNGSRLVEQEPASAEICPIVNDRPERDTVIGSGGEMTDLKIALETDPWSLFEDES